MRDDHNDEAELVARVDRLLADLSQPRTPLPPPEERVRLREAAALSTAQIAGTLRCHSDDIAQWEAGTQEPLAARRAAYAHLLNGLAALPPLQPHDEPPPQHALPAAPAGQAEQPALFSTTPSPAQAPPSSLLSQPAAIPAGPLAVIDHTDTLIAHFTNGTRLPLNTSDLVNLLRWTLDSGLSREPLSPYDQPGDPLLVLTAAASTALGLPTELDDRAALRLPATHPVLVHLAQAGFKLTHRGFGPWPRAYLPPVNKQRRSVQLAIMAWGALSEDGWHLPPLRPADLAHVLGLYTERLLTPRGSTAVCGQELMTALRPPTKPVRDPSSGTRISGPNPGALHQALEPAPPEAPDAHPLAEGRPPEHAMQEEAWDWSRQPDTQETFRYPHVVGLDTNLAFLSAASSLPVALNSPPRHVMAPTFDKKTPGCWYCDLSQTDLDPRLPSPFTATGQAPTGPAWYTTPTLEYAQSLGIDVRPIEAYLRNETGRYLDPWYKRLRNAYMATMADLGVHEKIPQADYLTAMSKLAAADPAQLALLAAIKATAKGGLGKLREGPRYIASPYTRWPALNKPTWRPDIRAAVIAKARVILHGKIRKLAEQTGRYPLAVLSDCVLYPARTPSALDIVPDGPDQQGIQGLIRLGVNPGCSKVEGTQSTSWYQHQLTQGLNPARYIKNE
ncbi:telomere-associated protein Tap [Streptomyces olivaceus]|uniref:telomere-associated protein Tap n=1 Tax=Streptomyces olivaceus TaxID=47716 RepID=UPI001CCAFD6E|nr:transcriptional regulator [Streptomyces olivaceus]